MNKFNPSALGAFSHINRRRIRSSFGDMGGQLSVDPDMIGPEPLSENH